MIALGIFRQEEGKWIVLLQGMIEKSQAFTYLLLRDSADI
jgi:hypothetical protein